MFVSWSFDDTEFGTDELAVSFPISKEIHLISIHKMSADITVKLPVYFNFFFGLQYIM